MSIHQDHPRQSEVKNVVNKVKYEYIYLATELEYIANRFRDTSPNIILINKRRYYDKAMQQNGTKRGIDIRFERENFKEIEYLSSIIYFIEI